MSVYRTIGPLVSVCTVYIVYVCTGYIVSVYTGYIVLFVLGILFLFVLGILFLFVQGILFLYVLNLLFLFVLGIFLHFDRLFIKWMASVTSSQHSNVQMKRTFWSFFHYRYFYWFLTDVDANVSHL